MQVKKQLKEGFKMPREAALEKAEKKEDKRINFVTTHSALDLLILNFLLNPVPHMKSFCFLLILFGVLCMVKTSSHQQQRDAFTCARYHLPFISFNVCMMTHLKSFVGPTLKKLCCSYQTGLELPRSKPSRADRPTDRPTDIPIDRPTGDGQTDIDRNN